MKAKGSLDANVLLRWLLNDIPAQAAAVDSLFAKAGKFHVSDLAIIEVAYILEKMLSFPRSLVAENLLQVLEHPKCLCNVRMFSRAISRYTENPKLSLVDCCLATYAVLNNATPLYTFDKKLANQLEGAALLGSQ